ncbi:TonB-dependent receptor [Spirosoma aureum]|uniref:TonB-dependent receptor n=1 Tax=Spirosoma aureum TaxID=2692134 RepID=A0A6G9AL88_9BACT|nr:TonB-dependent receptor [Spirosoma aureum]QIP12973.1 TonB-dependent receptor [Spirosoma aureum]
MQVHKQLPLLGRILVGVVFNTLVVILIFSGSSQAFRSETQDMLSKKISIQVNNEPVKKVFRNLNRLTGVKFVYNSGLIDENKRVSVKANEKSLAEVLNGIFEPLGIGYSVQDKLVLLKSLHSPATAEAGAYQTASNTLKVVTGKVTEKNAGPLPGVSIVVKGTQRGTVTNENGSFTIDLLAQDSILVFSFIGYQNLEENIRNRSEINVELIPENRSLDEVVVVGYGTQKVSDLTGSVTRISEKELQSRPVPSFQDAIQGRSSGVYVRQTGGNLDGRFSISVRGTGSVTGSNDPLVVVDGVPLFSGGFSTINPKDIVAVDILKDASATAIYGARAANGVLLITTRRGKEGKSNITFSADIGIEQMSKQYHVLTTEQQRRLFVDAFKNTGKNTAAYEDLTNPAWQVDTDWQKLGTRTAARRSYSLGLSGGTDKSTYSISIAHLDRQGTMRNSDFKSYSFRANNDITIKNRLKVSANLTGSHQIQHVLNQDSWGGGSYGGLLSNHSYTKPYDDNGNLTAINTAADPYFGANANPLIDQLQPVREEKLTRLLGAVKADLDIVKGLRFGGSLGADLVIGNNYSYLPVYQIGLFNRQQGSVTTRAGQDLNWLTDATLQYDKNINKHAVKVLVGFSTQQFNTRSATTTGTGTLDNALNQLSNQTNFNATGAEVTSGLVSSFARLNYSFDDKYLLTATVRRDGSSKFGPTKRYGTFPSASVAWRVTQEDFARNIPGLHELKLRSSYGLTGNQNIGDFSFITRAGPASYVYDNTVVIGNAVQNIGNPNLQWESARQFDAGLDLSLLKGRLALTLDYYHKLSDNLLIRTPVPFTSGVQEDPTVNIGSLKNTGFEFSLNSQNVVGKVNWSTNFNFSTNKNVVLDIGKNSIGNPLQIQGAILPLSNEATNLTVTGRPVGSFYMYRFIGIWQLGEEEAAKKWANAVPGDLKFADNNQNGIMDEGDKEFVGQPQPKVFGGINNTISYNGFSVSFLFNFAAGNKLYHSMRNLNARAVPFNQQLAEVADYWTPTNPTNKVPRASQQSGNTTFLATKVSTRYLENADFLRLKNVNLSYDFSEQVVKKLRLDAARLTLSATNLFTLTKYTGLDPEASSNTSLLSAGIDLTPYPLTKLYSLSILVTF